MLIDFFAKQARTSALVVLVLVGALALPSPARADAFTPTAALAHARSYATATTLASGKVLVTGGKGATQTEDSAELYDPVTGTWSAAASMAVARYQHTATLLPSGKVLIVGGRSFRGADYTTEIYDPGSNTWSAGPSLTAGRFYHAAVALVSGKVLVLGGHANGTVVLGSAELYDPTANSWSSAGNMASTRQEVGAALVGASGKVLVVGGSIDDTGTRTATAELYDPAANTWANAASLASARDSYRRVVRLSSGKVLIAGGYDGSNALASTEIYDASVNSWSTAASMATARSGHTLAVLASGRVLAASGFSAGNYLSSVEVYDPATNIWSAAGTLATPRSIYTTSAIAAGKVLLAGGSNGAVLANADVFTESAAVQAPMIAASFNPTSISVGATSTLTITIINPAANTIALTGVGFSATLPVGLGVASGNVPKCGGTLTTTAPLGIALAGATIATGGQCQFTLSVVGIGPGNFTPSFGPVAANESTGTGNVATASLAVSAVTPTPTTTTLNADSSATSFGQNVLFTAVVNVPNGSGGTVTFTDGVNVLCNAVPFTGSSGAGLLATCATSALAIGPHTILAQYSGDATHAGSTSNPVAHSVNAAQAASAVPAPMLDRLTLGLLTLLLAFGACHIGLARPCSRHGG